jgi:hypothetical protein
VSGTRLLSTPRVVSFVGAGIFIPDHACCDVEIDNFATGLDTREGLEG